MEPAAAQGEELYLGTVSFKSYNFSLFTERAGATPWPREAVHTKEAAGYSGGRGWGGITQTQGTRVPRAHCLGRAWNTHMSKIHVSFLVLLSYMQDWSQKPFKIYFSFSFFLTSK